MLSRMTALYPKPTRAMILKSVNRHTRIKVLFSTSQFEAPTKAVSRKRRDGRRGSGRGQRSEKVVSGPFDYHEEVVVRVEALTNLGDGIARVEVPKPTNSSVTDLDIKKGYVVMVPLVIPGELVRVRVWANRSTHSVADLVEVIEASPRRIAPPCEFFGTCGGCQYQYMTIEEQRMWKRQHVLDSLERIGGFKDLEVEAVIGSEHIYGYRSKLTPHYDKPDRETGEIGPIGFMRRHGKGRLVDVPHCLIATDAINERLKGLREDVKKKAVENVGNGRKKRGATLLLRDASSTGGGVVTDPNKHVLEQVEDLTFKFRAGEFFQNNPYVLPKLVAYVADRATRGSHIKNLIDAYCGGGLFCLTLSKHLQQCAGIEISDLNIQSAKGNARLNGIANCDFVSGSAESIFGQVDQSQFDPSSTCVVIDPPRKGCSDEFLAQLFAFMPSRLVYVSCDPATQARDAAAILLAGFRLEEIQPFDLFPQTRHIENVITFDRIDR